MTPTEYIRDSESVVLKGYALALPCHTCYCIAINLLEVTQMATRFPSIKDVRLDLVFEHKYLRSNVDIWGGDTYVDVRLQVLEDG